LWILAALAYFLVPVVQRSTAAKPVVADERVLAELNGVELVATRSRSGLEVRRAPPARLRLRRRGSPSHFTFDSNLTSVPLASLRPPLPEETAWLSATNYSRMRMPTRQPPTRVGWRARPRGASPSSPAWTPG